MARTPKTPKFTAFNHFSNSFGRYQQHNSTWQEYLQHSDQPLVVEIGCARARFVVALAEKYPRQHFLGVDRKSDRMYFPAKRALADKLSNIAFIQTDTRDIYEYIQRGSVDEIWLTFPDPYPRDRQEKHRMSGGNFLQIYASVLKNDGKLHLKTDNHALFAWSLEQLNNSELFNLEFYTYDLHSEEGNDDAKILTVYEEKYLQDGLKTKYLIATKQ